MSQLAASPSLSPAARWKFVIMLMAFAALGHFNRVGITVAGSEVFIPQLGISPDQMGLVYTTFLIVYTLAMLPGGWLIDRIGPARALALYGTTMGLFVMLTGVLGWIIQDAYLLWAALLVIRGFGGMCNAPLHPGAARVVSDIVADRGRATSNGMITAGAVIGVALTYPIFGWMIDRLNWPLAFIVSGLVFATFAALWYAVSAPLRHSHTVAHVEATEPLAAADFQRLLCSRPLWLLGLSYAAFGYFQYLFFYWMGYYFQEILKVPTHEARWATFWILLAQGAGMIIGGLSTDNACRRFGPMNGRRLIVMTGMGFAAIFGLLGVSVTGMINVAMCLALSMAALGLCEGVFWTTATDLGGRAKGLAGAFINTLGNVGGLISPALTPAMARSIGWEGSIGVACAVVCLGGAVWFFIRIDEYRTPELVLEPAPV